MLVRGFSCFSFCVFVWGFSGVGDRVSSGFEDSMLGFITRAHSGVLHSCIGLVGFDKIVLGFPVYGGFT